MFIDLRKCDDKPKTQEYSWLPTLQLSMNDYRLLVGEDWLTDSLINAAQKLLKKSYPKVGGLQVTTEGEVLSFDVETGEFVQILSISGVHWITISTSGCLPGEVNVFDSMPSTDLPKRAKEQIASIIYTPKHKFILNFQATQTQVGSNDCGVFSIAFATSVCAGVNPAAVFYHQTLLRRHLIDSLVKGEIILFQENHKTK